jgi:hypothetical protein
VTRPTTIKAITDMPAKTPRPIGRTESFLPGSWNASVDSEGCSAAAADAPDADAFASGAAVTGVLVGLVVIVGNPAVVEVVPVGVGIPVTVDTPLAWIPDTGGALDEANEVVATDEEAPELVEVPVAVVVPVAVEDPDTLVDEVWLSPVDVIVAGGELSAVVDVPVEVPVTVGGVVFPAVFAVVKVVTELLAELPAPPPPPSGLSYAREHFLTSSTAGCPFLSVIGVRVITHVSVKGPAIVWVVCTVWTVVAPFWRIRSGRALTRFIDRKRE